MKRTGLQIPASLMAIQTPETQRALRAAISGAVLGKRRAGKAVAHPKPIVFCDVRTSDGVEVILVRVEILGLKLRSTANWRPSVRERIAYPKHIRAEVTAAFAGVTLPEPPCDVIITRVGPRMLDPTANLPVSAKAVEDAIAALFGIDDADPRVKYAVEQRKGPYAVEIQVRRR